MLPAEKGRGARFRGGGEEICVNMEPGEGRGKLLSKCCCTSSWPPLSKHAHTYTHTHTQTHTHINTYISTHTQLKRIKWGGWKVACKRGLLGKLCCAKGIRGVRNLSVRQAGVSFLQDATWRRIRAQTYKHNKKCEYKAQNGRFL